MILDNNKSAKDYISEAYVQELKAIQETAKLMETPTSIIEKEKVEKTLALAEEVISMNILNEEITSEYNELNRKIQTKKEEISKLYGIEIYQDSLQAIKNAYKLVYNGLTEYLQNNKEEFEASQKEELENITKKITDEENTINEKVTTINEAIKIRISENKQETQREQAEYDYNLKRSRKRDKEEREKIIIERENAMKFKEQEIQLKKQECLDKLEEINQLQIQVDNIPNLIEQAKVEGASIKEKELGKDYGYKSAMAKKDSENEIANLQNEYDRLLTKYNTILNEKNILSNKLDNSYAESRQLATDTVKSIGGINILNTDNHQQSNYNKK